MNLAVLGAIAASNRAHGYSLWNNGNPHSCGFKYLNNGFGIEETVPYNDITKDVYRTASEIVINNENHYLKNNFFIIGCQTLTFSEASELKKYTKMRLLLKKNASAIGTFSIMADVIYDSAGGWSDRSSPYTLANLNGVNASSFTDDSLLIDFVLVHERIPATQTGSGKLYRIGIEFYPTDTPQPRDLKLSIQKWQLLK